MTARPDVRVQHIGFRESGQFAARDVAYAEGDAALLGFAEGAPTLENFATALERRRRRPVDRATLVAVLSDQYKSYGLKAPENLKRLGENEVYTVVTAHQASLFLGPLYYVYKILSAVALARQLNESYPATHVVPVFVLGAEDHDLDEIDHLFVNDVRIKWSTNQSGATGAMRLDQIETAIEAVATQLGESLAAQQVLAQLRRVYRPDRTLGEATAAYVAELFGAFGVVVANLNDARFKANFRDVIEREVLHQESVALVEETQTQLAEVGFGAQAHAREINFFYLQPGRRDRIERDGEGFRVLGTDLRFTKDEMQREIAAHPERFSPNVVTRPLLQESCLPNLAYVGGGGELAYWLERKSQFAHFRLPFPVLVRRDSAWWIEGVHVRTLDKLGLTPAELLVDLDGLLRRYVREHSGADLDFSPHREAFAAQFADLSARAAAVDPTLRQRPLALGAEVEHRLRDLETRLVRSLKQQQAGAVERIREVHGSLLPGGGLQERRESFLTLYVRYGMGFFEVLLNHFDPLDMRLKVFVEPVGTRVGSTQSVEALA